MQYGHFDDKRREYVITTPNTPRPWINYLGNGTLFSLISHTGGGYTFYQDARLRRLTRYRYHQVPRDVGARNVYINEAGDLWSPLYKPMKYTLDDFTCRHGMGTTEITSSRNGIRVRLRWCIPRDEQVELQDVLVENVSESVRDMEFYSCVEFSNYNALDDMTNFQRNLNIGEVHLEPSMICHTTEYRERRDHYSWYGVNCDPSGFDTDREVFLGPDGDYRDPAVPRSGGSENSIVSGWFPIGAFRVSLHLEPGESRRIVFMLGYQSQRDKNKWASPGIPETSDARRVLDRFSNPSEVDRAFEDLSIHWDRLLSRFQAETGEDPFDRMASTWNQYQCVQNFYLSRSASYYESGIGRGIGFRDTNQDMLGVMHLLPDECRHRILDVASIQFTDGSAYHQYQPMTKRGNGDVGTGFNDDPLWLVYAAVSYIKETGDWTILDEPVTFADEPDTPVQFWDHLHAVLEHYSSSKGVHGLPLIGRADWNDCLNLNAYSDDPDESFQTCENRGGNRAESVLIAGIFAFIAPDWAELCRRTGRLEESARIERELELTEKAVIDHGWDGSWYLRAYDDHMNPVGTSEDSEGKIFIEPQGFCSMARIGEEEGYPRRALDAVKQLLVSDHGIQLNTPAFTSYRREYGEISSYPPGYKENAGIFCHNNPWVMIAEILQGDPDQAYAYYRLINPAYRESISEIHRAEPYVYSQMIAGPDAPRFGEAKNSWLTGTASWNVLVSHHYMLGIRPEFDGLLIDPALPSWLSSARVRRLFRDRWYDISITRMEEQEYQIEVNGKIYTSPVLLQHTDVTS